MPEITRRSALRLAGAAAVGTIAAATGLVREPVPAAATPAATGVSSGPGTTNAIERVYAFTHATVIDATGAPPRRNATVVVRGERIVAVGDDAAIPAGADVVDLSGKYLIPGLVDMHVHSFPYEHISPALYLANGVTTVREMSGTPQLRDWRERAERRELSGPRWIVASPIIDGSPSVGTGESFIEVATVAEVRRAVRGAKRDGADFVKVYSRLPRHLYWAAVSEARRQGMPLVGHCPDEVPLREASAAGQDSIEHLYGVWLETSTREAELRRAVSALQIEHGDFLTWMNEMYRLEWEAVNTYSAQKAERLFTRLARHWTHLVPTLTVYRVLDDPAGVDLDDGRLKYVPAWAAGSWPWALEHYIAGSRTPEESARWRRLFERRLELVGALDRAGVPVLAGTDAGDMPFVFPGFGLHDELALLVRAGLTPMRALQAATLEPARLLGDDHLRGTVERGKVADLVVLDADPLADITNTTRIHAVVTRGDFTSADQRRRLLADVERSAAEETQPPH